MAWIGVVVVAACVGVGTLVGSCGAVAAQTGTASAEPAGSTGALAGVFGALAKRVAPMCVYGWTADPQGATLCTEWLPVITEQHPGESSGAGVSNPRVLQGDPGAAEVQVVIDYHGGWIVVVENFRGDLGDVAGTAVGQVAGHEAWLYSVNGGSLVQWSTDGRWYGVFGRDVPSDEVAALALKMAPIGIDGAGR